MSTASYRNLTFDEIEIGATVTVSRPVTHTGIAARFIALRRPTAPR